MNEAEPTRGVRIGVDVGSVRVGVAASDPDGILAVPVTTLRRGALRGARSGASNRRKAGKGHPGGDTSDLQELADIVRERQAVEVVVGFPRHLSGEEGQAVRQVRKYAEALAALIAPVPVRLVDERLTTVAAHRRMAERGLRSRARRDLVDQEAAVQILQHYLETHRVRGGTGREDVPPPAGGSGGSVRPVDPA